MTRRKRRGGPRWLQSGPLRMLRQPHFRWYIAGRLAGSPTGPIRSIVQGWLVYQLTGSLLALGGLSALRSATMALLAPAAGVLTDRVDKRKVMLWARVMLTIVNGALAALAFTGHMAVWHLFAGAVLEGLALAAKDPAEQAILADLVSQGALSSAISTTAIFEGLMGMVSATLGGFLLARAGPGSLFFALAALFALCGFTYLHLPESAPVRHSGEAVHRDLVKVVRYLRGAPMLFIPLVIEFARILLLGPYNDFLPALVDVHFRMDAEGLGWLKSAAGAGQMVSSLAVASLGYIKPAHERRTVMLAGAAAGAILMLFLQFPLMPLPFLFIFLEAALSSVSRVMNRSVLQTSCVAQYRGRVISLSLMLMHLARLGTISAGALADRYGVVRVLTVAGALAAVVHLGVGPVWARLAAASSTAPVAKAPGGAAAQREPTMTRE